MAIKSNGAKNTVNGSNALTRYRVDRRRRDPALNAAKPAMHPNMAMTVQRRRIIQ